MTRKPDWQLWFDALLTSRVHAPFCWGRHDCVLFAADAVQAITGVDLAADQRGYRGARAATRMLQAHGGVRALASRTLGQPIALGDARQGDVALVLAGRREALAVVLGDQVVAPGPHGLSAVPLTDALCAWRVG